nr:hypothetical protein Iba_chr14aCG8420 [Ipomoea batatas]
MPATYDLRRRRTPDAHFPSAVFRGNIRVSQMRVSADPHFQLGSFVRGPRWQCPHSWTTTSNHTFTTYRDELDRCQVENVEALRQISIQGAIAAEQGQSNNYTNVKQQIATNELNRLNYGYVLQFPRTACAYFYEPIDQVLGPDQRRQGNRRGRAVQGGHRRQHSPHINLNDEVHMEVQHDDPEMGDVMQQDFTQTLMSQSPFRTPYVAHGHVFEDGSSSQSPRHVAWQVRSPSNQIPNAPFEHPIQSSYYNNNEETTLNTSQVLDPTQTQELTGLVQYQRRRPTRNIRRPPCGTE